MSGHGEKRTRAQEQAIVGLLTFATIVEAADYAHISESTLRRWMGEQGFAADYKAAKDQAVSHAVGVLQAATSEAAATLTSALHADNDAVRVRAAVAIFDLAQRSQVDDLTARIVAIEQQLAKQNQPGRVT